MAAVISRVMLVAGRRRLTALRGWRLSSAQHVLPVRRRQGSAQVRAEGLVDGRHCFVPPAIASVCVPIVHSTYTGYDDDVG